MYIKATSLGEGFNGGLIYLVASLMPPTPDFPDFCEFLIFFCGFWAPGDVPAARSRNSASDGLRESPR